MGWGGGIANGSFCWSDPWSGINSTVSLPPPPPLKLSITCLGFCEQIVGLDWQKKGSEWMDSLTILHEFRLETIPGTVGTPAYLLRKHGATRRTRARILTSLTLAEKFNWFRLLEIVLIDSVSRVPFDLHWVRSRRIYKCKTEIYEVSVSLETTRVFIMNLQYDTKKSLGRNKNNKLGVGIKIELRSDFLYPPPPPYMECLPITYYLSSRNNKTRNYERAHILILGKIVSPFFFYSLHI